MEIIILRMVIKLVAVCIGLYYALSQIHDGIAKICYKVVSPCFIEVERGVHPYGFWVVIGIYIIISLIFLMSLIKDIGRLRKRLAENIDS